MSDSQVRAAGGVVIDTSEGELQVAAVHRPKYDDWSLPKGKLDPGESWEEAALREVREETGLECELHEELTPTSYNDREGRSKLVRWWCMSSRGGEFAANDEVDELRWLSVAQAEALLDYEPDRSLVREASSESGGLPGSSG